MIDWEQVKAGKQSIDDVLAYNAIEDWVTSESRHKQIEELKTDPKYQEAFDFDMKKLTALWPVSRRRVRIDISALYKLKEAIAGEIKNAQFVVDLVNAGPLNVKSNKQVPDL